MHFFESSQIEPKIHFDLIFTQNLDKNKKTRKLWLQRKHKSKNCIQLNVEFLEDTLTIKRVFITKT